MPSLPTDVAEIFQLLENDVLWLHVKWKVYRQLFGTEEHYVQLMNESAPLAFAIYQEVLLHDVLLTLTRLTDPETTGKGKWEKENLTLERLVNLIDPLCPTLACAAQKHLDDARQYCKPFRDLRNRVYAHRDLLTARKVHPNPLPGVSREMVETALGAVRNLMSTISNYARASDENYDQILFLGGGDSIVKCLKESQAYRKHQRTGRVNPTEDGID